MPQPNPVDVTDAELAVLRALWERPGATIRELADALYPDGGASGYATVQKLLDRLESKRCVRRARGAQAHRFTAAVDRDDLIGRRLQAVAESLCDGSLAPLLSHLVTQPLTEPERETLRRLIEKLDQPRPSVATRKRPPGRSK